MVTKKTLNGIVAAALLGAAAILFTTQISRNSAIGPTKLEKKTKAPTWSEPVRATERSPATTSDTSEPGGDSSDDWLAESNSDQIGDREDTVAVAIDFIPDHARVGALFGSRGSALLPEYLENLILTEEIDEDWAAPTSRKIDGTFASIFTTDQSQLVTECLQMICYTDIAISSLPVRRMTQAQRNQLFAQLPDGLYEQVIFVKKADEIQRAYLVRNSFDILAAEREIGAAR